MRFPLVAEEGYPADWPALDASVAPCGEVTGTYRNVGESRSTDGKSGPVRLSELLRLPFEAGQLSVTASTDGKHPDGICFCTFEVHPEDNDEVRTEVPNCFCGHGTVAIHGLEQSGGVEPLGMYGQQASVWMTVAKDGSLIALREHAYGGFLLIVPFYFVRDTWARFERVPREDAGAGP